MEEQGRPAESKQSTRYKVIRFVLDVLLLMAIFYAGHVYGELVLGDGCPDIDVVKRCYVNTNMGVLSISDYNEMLITNNDDICAIGGGEECP